MTIIKNPAAIRYHPFIAIDTDVADLIIQGAEVYRQTANIKSFSILAQLKMLEAYCDITDQRITMETLRSPTIEKILQGFMVIMAGKELVDLSDPSKYCRTIYTVLNSSKIHQPDLHQVTWDINNLKSDESTCARFAKKATDFQRWYWEGWEIQQKYHPSRYLRLAQLVAPYGREFVESAYYEIEKLYRNRTNTFRPMWNNMFDYLNKHHAAWPLKVLKTEAGLKSFMQAFTIFYFRNAEKKCIDAQSAIKNWNRFVDGVEVCLCKSSVLTNLSSPIKRPPSSTKHGSQTKIKENEEGLLIQEKLLTNIPLHVTDTEAIELLFFHIKNDLATVRNWATAQVADFKSRYNTRVTIAQAGTSIVDYSTRYAYKKYTLEDICATLEDIDSTVPAKYLCKIFTHITNEKCSAEQLAHRFGLPLANSLFPFQCLLVLEHPEITTEFLKRFELYQKNGNLFGFDEENRNLIGYKDRKQPDTREQIISLNDRSFNIIKDIIDITRIGRRKLQAENNDAYRYLFLTSGASIRPFKLANITIRNNFSLINKRGLREQLIQEFRPHSDLPEADLVEFILRVRLTRLRASRAVEIFIQSKSSEQMSKALGHENYCPDLLSHYLPDPVLAFIKARWIRIFQKAVVCEAMKDSPYLFRVTHFNNMDELDSFLDKHRISEIPSQASDPERKAQREEIDTSEAVLSIGVPFLTSLLSLEAAVLASNNRARVCGRAEFWASFAEKIKIEIFSGSKRLLKQYLTTAIKMVDAKKMEALIYVPGYWT